MDATLTLLARDGSETLINESTLQYPGAPALREVEKAVRSAVRVSAETPFRIRTVPLEGGDFIIIALSTSEIDANFISDLQYLALVTLILNSFAAGLLFLYFRRERRTADSASLARMQEFLGDASHELRTPIFNIQGYVLTLLDGVKDQKVRKDYLKKASRNVERMIRLVQDMDVLARLESNQLVLQKEAYSLTEQIEDALEQMSDRIAQQELTVVRDFDPESDCAVYADPERMDQVVLNLISNAIKYSRDESGGFVRVAIEDSGLDHRIAFDLKGIVIALARQHLTRNSDGMGHF